MDLKVVDIFRQMSEQNKFLRDQIAWMGFRQTCVKFERDPKVEISFEREISIGESPEQPIGGMGGFAVNDSGRIYISDYQQQTLHVVESNGEYLTSVGRSGDGPGNILVDHFPR